MDINNLIVWLFTLLGILVAVLIAKWNTYSKESNKKILRWRFNILIILIIVFLIISIIFYLNSIKLEEKRNQEQIEIQFENDCREVEFEIENQNYIDAAKKIDSILGYVKSIDEKKYVELLIWKGSCYLDEMFLLLLENDDQATFYAEKSISVLNDVLLNEGEISKKQLIRIKYTLGMAYLFLGDEENSEELDGIISFFEGANKDELTEIWYGSVSMLLGMYYENKYYGKQSEIDLKKTLQYYEETINYMSNLEDINSQEKSVLKLIKEKVANFYMRQAFNNIAENKESLEFLEKSILLYDELMRSCNINKETKLYYQCLKDQGRCYYYMETIYEKYTGRAYKNFVKFIYRDEIYFDSLLVGSYVFLELNVTDEDVEMILKRYYRLLEAYNESLDFKMVAEIKSDLVMCYYILAKKQHNIEYYTEGKVLLDDIYCNYLDYYNEKRLGAIEEMRVQYEKLKVELF